MYAVIESGGKQYRVVVGDKVKVESLKVKPGDKIDLDKVLLISDGDKLEVGKPTLKSAVQATVLGHGRGEKLRIVKFRRRQSSRTRTGHRQNYTELEITGIGGKAPAKAKPVKAKAAAPKAESKAPASEKKKVVAKAAGKETEAKPAAKKKASKKITKKA